METLWLQQKGKRLTKWEIRQRQVAEDFVLSFRYEPAKRLDHEVGVQALLGEDVLHRFHRLQRLVQVEVAVQSWKQRRLG